MNGCSWCGKRCAAYVDRKCYNCYDADSPLDAFKTLIEGLEGVNKELHDGVLKMFKLFCEKEERNA